MIRSITLRHRVRLLARTLYEARMTLVAQPRPKRHRRR